jgi:hypothetical protein
MNSRRLAVMEWRSDLRLGKQYSQYSHHQVESTNERVAGQPELIYRSSPAIVLLMHRSTVLKSLLETLARDARRAGLNDAAWAARAGLRKESLSRLRRRDTCDFATLHALAQAVGARVDVRPAAIPGLGPDGHFPAAVSRDLEERLADLCARDETDPDRWLALGPPFFMAGLAVMLAGAPGHDRSALLELAERLHPGASEPAVFARWLARSPVQPSRFLPAVKARSRQARARHAA